MATRTAATAVIERPRPPRHAGRNRELEDWLDSQNVAWTFHPDVPLDAFDETASLGNQVRFIPTIESTVDQYATAMTEGAKFPPILVYAKRNKFIRLDGNHRIAAARKVGLQTFHVYEAHVSTQAATLLSFKANNRNGLPNTEDERVSHAIYMIRSGASLKAAAAETVVSERVLKTAWGKEEANNRAKDIGIPQGEWDTLTSAVRGRLRSISTDEGFKAAAQLCYRAKLNIEELADIVTELNQSKSATKQTAVVKSYAENVYADRIRSSAGGVFSTAGRGKGRTPRQALGLALSSLANLPDDLSTMAEQYAGAERLEAAERTRDAGNRLIALADKLSAGA